MDQFSVIAVYLCILVVIPACILTVLERKRASKFFMQLDEKKVELIKIVDEAEQMVEELNRLSEYIVTQVENKNEELNQCLKNVDDRVCKIRESIKECEEMYRSLIKRTSADQEVVFKMPMTDGGEEEGGKNAYKKGQEMLPEKNELYDAIMENDLMQENSWEKARCEDEDKIIPLSNRHREVIKLAEAGMSDTEIARRLNIGKGEIQLILGVRNTTRIKG